MKTTKQTHIAKMAGISDAFLSEILAGKKTPYWETAKRLSNVTGIPVEIWMESKNNPKQLRNQIKGLKK
ncbi:MAG: transcriptional regulator [Desulfamplus sp.]